MLAEHFMCTALLCVLSCTAFITMSVFIIVNMRPDVLHVCRCSLYCGVIPCIDRFIVGVAPTNVCNIGIVLVFLLLRFGTGDSCDVWYFVARNLLWLFHCRALTHVLLFGVPCFDFSLS